MDVGGDCGDGGDWHGGGTGDGEEGGSSALMIIVRAFSVSSVTLVLGGGSSEEARRLFARDLEGSVVSEGSDVVIVVGSSSSLSIFLRSSVVMQLT